ncbi:MAG: hypothetical protein Q9P90_12205 [candidate division KSB1 bacterium]|nr:hypothetical protein [candidate division KSB1 bacterium]
MAGSSIFPNQRQKYFCNPRASARVFFSEPGWILEILDSNRLLMKTEILPSFNKSGGMPFKIRNNLFNLWFKEEPT